MGIRNVILIILTTLGLILSVMAGHDLFWEGSPTWLTGIEGNSLVLLFGIGIACLVADLIVLIVSGYNYRLSASVKGPQKKQHEYYGPGSDSFNGSYGDRSAAGGDVQSMVKGAFASSAPAQQQTAPVQQSQQASQMTTPIPVVVPQRTNEAVDPMAFAASRETPAGAAANMNPLYGGVVETKKADYVSPYAGQNGNVNYDPAYGGNQNPPQNN